METKTLAEIGTVVTGKTPSTSRRDYYGGDVPFITPTELHAGRTVGQSAKTLSEAGLQSIKGSILEGTSVLVGCIGWDIGNIAMTNDRCASNQQINAVTSITSEVNPSYLYYWLSTKKDYLFSIASVTRTPILSKSTFEQVKVPVPSRDVQDGIAHILVSIDDQIATNDQVNDNLYAMLQTLYGYWFLQFDFPDENGQPYRSFGGRMVWNNQLKREIPAGWRVGANEELFDGIRTGLNPRQNFSLRTQGIAYLTVKNLTKDGGLDFASCDYIDEEAMEKVRRRSDLRVGDILFASIAPLRRCFLIYEEPRDWEINESVFSIRPRRGVTTPEYVYCHLMSDAFVKQAEQSSTGSIFKGIRHETLKGLMTVIPPETIAQSYASAVSPIMRMRNDNLEENRKLQELRDWLLPMLMNGQATVASSDKLSFT